MALLTPECSARLLDEGQVYCRAAREGRGDRPRNAMAVIASLEDAETSAKYELVVEDDGRRWAAYQTTPARTQADGTLLVDIRRGHGDGNRKMRWRPLRGALAEVAIRGRRLSVERSPARPRRSPEPGLPLRCQLRPAADRCSRLHNSAPVRAIAMRPPAIVSMKSTQIQLMPEALVHVLEEAPDILLGFRGFHRARAWRIFNRQDAVCAVERLFPDDSLLHIPAHQPHALAAACAALGPWRARFERRCRTLPAPTCLDRRAI